MGQNHVSFGKLGNMSFDNFKGIRREHLNNANSSLDEGIFNKYDTNKDNVLDKGELEELKNDLLEYAGGNGQIGRREAKNFIKDKLGVNANYNREDLEAILSEIASGEDDVEFAETKGGVTTIRFRENAGVTTTQKHTVINEQVQLLEQTEEHADFKTVTKWNENGSSTVVKTYTDTSQPTETW